MQIIRIEVLGLMWMPMCKAAMVKKIRLGDGPFEVDIQPTLDEIEDWLTSNTGDFSKIIDWRAEYETTDRIENECTTVTWETSKLIKDWNSDENFCDFCDCFGE